MIDEKKIAEHVKGLLIALGDDPEREGLRDTPERVARMYSEVFVGMNYTNHEIAEMFNRTFSEGIEDEEERENAGAPGRVVVMKDIEFFSYCEHHMALMYDMKVSIAYIPRERVIGLSKIARIADMVGKRLQLQEKIGTDIAYIMEKATLSPDIAVIITGKHSCMTARGIKNTPAVTMTTTFRGAFADDERLQNRVLRLIDRKSEN